MTYFFRDYHGKVYDLKVCYLRDYELDHIEEFDTDFPVEKIVQTMDMNSRDIYFIYFDGSIRHLNYGKFLLTDSDNEPIHVTDISTINNTPPGAGKRCLIPAIQDVRGHLYILPHGQMKVIRLQGLPLIKKLVRNVRNDVNIYSNHNFYAIDRDGRCISFKLGSNYQVEIDERVTLKDVCFTDVWMSNDNSYWLDSDGILHRLCFDFGGSHFERFDNLPTIRKLALLRSVYFRICYLDYHGNVSITNGGFNSHDMTFQLIASGARDILACGDRLYISLDGRILVYKWNLDEHILKDTTQLFNGIDIDFNEDEQLPRYRLTKSARN